MWLEPSELELQIAGHPTPSFLRLRKISRRIVHDLANTRSVFNLGPPILNCTRLVSTHVTPSAPKVGHICWQISPLCSLGRAKGKHLGPPSSLSLSSLSWNCLKAFAMAVISRRGSIPPPLPPNPASAFLPCPKPLAGMNQRESHICTSCGAILHVQVTARTLAARVSQGLRDSMRKRGARNAAVPRQ